MKNQSRTIKTNPESWRVVMGSSGGHRRRPGGSDDFRDRQTPHHNIYIVTTTTITIAITWLPWEYPVFVGFCTLPPFDIYENIINITRNTCIPAVSIILISIILITRRTCVPLQWAAQPSPWGEGLSDNSLQWDSNSFSFFILIPFQIPLFSSSDYLFIFSSPLLLQVSRPASLEICLSCLIPRPIKLWWGLRRKRNTSIFKSVLISS